MRNSVLLPSLAVVAALALAGCGSGDKSSTSTTDTGAPETGTCPTAAPPAGAATAWTLAGTTGEIKVVAPTATTAPAVAVTTPFTIASTKIHTISEGSGNVITVSDMVSVCYQGVNGRDGKVFDSAYERGTPASFPLDGVVPGFQKAIVGQKPGATVAVAMTPDDGYKPMGGQPDAGIQVDDPLIFVLQIKGIEKTDGSE